MLPETAGQDDCLSEGPVWSHAEGKYTWKVHCEDPEDKSCFDILLEERSQVIEFMRLFHQDRLSTTPLNMFGGFSTGASRYFFSAY